MVRRKTIGMLLLILLWPARVAFAQFDLVGSWAARNT
jgi:hypothetical protein